VGLGAYGAHGLARSLAGDSDIELRIGWWQTAVQYHLLHAVALVGVAWLTTKTEGRAAPLAAVCFAIGILLFSGTLYAMTLGAPRFLGAVTPLGGLSLVVGWLALALSARTFTR
ncbi:MAG: DUF423 domain-containing protein, partial [Sandaracinaceae bacterium]